jgi:hypothetical protein
LEQAGGDQQTDYDSDGSDVRDLTAATSLVGKVRVCKEFKNAKEYD